MRPGFRRCTGRVVRRSLVGKSCPVLNARRAVIADAAESAHQKATTLSTGGDGVRDSSTDVSIHARVSACLDMEDRAASAAAGLLSRINAEMLGNGAMNDSSTEQSQSQGAHLRNDLSATLNQGDRAAAAAARFLERVKGTNASICTPADEIPRRCKARQVRFDMSSLVIHDVTPYGEIYGLHPREFVFSKDYSMLPAAPPHGFVGMESTSEEEDGESSESDDE